ncbi:LuxR C-terminal-related transcriptional regulator [Actinomadura rubrisoli]|uniref:LuxR C-terminal-related transcriptional regulator n=1 Tax=Actinomadura rubrisoli TaxID=2530368 RepID=UPI0014052709|nr:response regulator transcription factor [Actinomadura rubrisoli]
MIIGDNPVLRIGLHSLLCSVPMLDVVGNAAIGHSMGEVRRHEPDVVLLDSSPPSTANISALARVRHNPRIVVVTAVEEPQALIQALMAGALSCLVYGHFEPEALADVVFAAERGESRLSQPVVNALVRWLHEGRTPESWRHDPGLTPREVEILELIAAGLTNRQIARRLVISEKTVKNHAHQIYKRLGADGRDHATVRWRELNSAPSGDGFDEPEGDAASGMPSGNSCPAGS